MNTDLKNAIASWNYEVEEEAIRLIERGTAPYDAIEKAKRIVSERRKCKTAKL